MRDMNFFAGTMRLHVVRGFRHDPHAVVSCPQCHQMMLAMNLEVHRVGHISGGIYDPTVMLMITDNKKGLVVSHSL